MSLEEEEQPGKKAPTSTRVRPNICDPDPAGRSLVYDQRD